MNEGKYRIPCKKCEYRFVSILATETLCPDCKNLRKDKYTNRFRRIRRNLPDDSSCYVCKLAPPKVVLCIHHVDRDIRNDAASNLVILCTKCHASLHSYDEPSRDIDSVSPASIYYGKFGARWEAKQTVHPSEISNQLVSLLLFNKVWAEHHISSLQSPYDQRHSGSNPLWRYLVHSLQETKGVAR